MFKILDRYLLTQFTKLYFVSLFTISFLFLLIDVVSTLNRFDVSGGVLLGYYLNYLPWIFFQMQPIAGVMATVFLFVNLQKHSELVVFYSLGVSIYRVLRPILSGLLLASLFSWVLADVIVPKAMEKRNYYYYVEMKKNPGSYNKLKKDNVWFRTPEAIVNFGKVVNENQVEEVSVFFYDAQNWEPSRVIQASSARLDQDKWIYKNGVEKLYEQDSVRMIKFDEISTKSLEDLSDFKKTQSNLNSMSLSELSYAIKKAKKSSMASTNLEVEYYGKLSFIFSALFLSLLALPFCMGHARFSSAFVGLGFSLLIVLIYWVLYSAGLNLGRAGAIPPILAGWGVGILSLLLSFVLVRRKS